MCESNDVCRKLGEKFKNQNKAHKIGILNLIYKTFQGLTQGNKVLRKSKHFTVKNENS